MKFLKLSLLLLIPVVIVIVVIIIIVLLIIIFIVKVVIIIYQVVSIVLLRLMVSDIGLLGWHLLLNRNMNLRHISIPGHHWSEFKPFDEAILLLLRLNRLLRSTHLLPSHLFYLRLNIRFVFFYECFHRCLF